MLDFPQQQIFFPDLLGELFALGAIARRDIHQHGDPVILPAAFAPDGACINLAVQRLRLGSPKTAEQIVVGQQCSADREAGIIFVPEAVENGPAAASDLGQRAPGFQFKSPVGVNDAVLAPYQLRHHHGDRDVVEEVLEFVRLQSFREFNGVEQIVDLLARDIGRLLQLLTPNFHVTAPRRLRAVRGPAQMNGCARTTSHPCSKRLKKRPGKQS